MKKKSRFITVYKQGGVSQVKILADTETGVHYLFHADGHAGGMTVLLDEAGKPVVDKSVIEETEEV